MSPFPTDLGGSHLFTGTPPRSPHSCCSLIGRGGGGRFRTGCLNTEQWHQAQHRLLTLTELQQETKMVQYSDLDLQDSIKEKLFGSELHVLEKKCSGKLERLKALLEEHLQRRISMSELMDKTLSLFTLRRTILTHNGYSRYSRDILRLFPEAEDDVSLLL